MSKVSLEEAILLLRSNCFDKGGVAVGEMSPLSETWAKDLVNIEPLKMSDIEIMRAPASCTGACLGAETLLRTMSTPRESSGGDCFVPSARLSEPSNFF